MKDITIKATIDDEEISSKMQKIIEKNLSARFGAEIKELIAEHASNAANEIVQRDNFVTAINAAVDECMRKRIEELLDEKPGRLVRVLGLELTDLKTENGVRIRHTIPDWKIVECLMATTLYRSMADDERVRDAVIDRATQEVSEKVINKVESKFNKVAEKNAEALKLLNNITKLTGE